MKTCKTCEWGGFCLREEEPKKGEECDAWVPLVCECPCEKCPNEVDCWREKT